MSSLIIDYRYRSGDKHIYSQFTIFESIDSHWNPCYRLIEIYSYDHVPVRKKLSLKTIKRVSSKISMDEIGIEEHNIYNISEFFTTYYSYMEEESLVILKDWISKEMMNSIPYI